VIDTGETLFSDTTDNSFFLRQTVMHEAGHGLGLLHNCPILEEKLMEPFLSEFFEGPQHDDIRGVSHFYGDVYEYNNSVATASNLGTLAIGSPLAVGAVPPPAMQLGSTVSLDGTFDEDYYYFSVTEPAALDVTAAPVGAIYQNNDQECPGNPANCCSGTFINTLNLRDLNVELRAADGTAILASGNSAPAGSAEVINNYTLPYIGVYYLRVWGSNASNWCQLYTLALSAGTPPFRPLSISFSSAAPTEFAPDVPTTLDIVIDPGDETITPESQVLSYRYDTGGFQTLPLIPAGGNDYSVTVPAPACGDTVQYFVSAVGDVSGPVDLPTNGASAPFIAIVASDVAQAFADDFEADLGWTVSGDAQDGQWQRGYPQGNDRGDPAADADGSGQCYLTDIDPNTSNSDVDNGATTLTSPVFDMSLGGTIAYSWWLNDIITGLLNQDSLTVEIATDPAGTNWTTLRTYTTALASWRADVIDVGDEVPASSTVRIRFSAADLGPASVIECGIDAVVVDAWVCQSSATCADGIQNQGEARIDCGGPCPACACTADAVCDDGFYCTGGEACDAFGECQPSAFPCSASDWCDESTETCVPHGNGDFDDNGTVDLWDFAKFQECFGQPAGPECAPGNLVGTDGIIDAADSMAFVSTFSGL